MLMLAFLDGRNVERTLRWPRETISRTLHGDPTTVHWRAAPLEDGVPSCTRTPQDPSHEDDPALASACARMRPEATEPKVPRPEGVCH